MKKGKGNTGGRMKKEQVDISLLMWIYFNTDIYINNLFSLKIYILKHLNQNNYFYLLKCLAFICDEDLCISFTLVFKCRVTPSSHSLCAQTNYFHPAIIYN